MTNTTSTVKLTKSMKFDLLLNIPAVAENDMLVEFIMHEKELLAKKNISSSTGEKKLTAVQKANEDIKTAIVANMEYGKEYTISDLIKVVPECADFNTSKVSALVKQLIVAEKVKREERKGRAYFSLV